MKKQFIKIAGIALAAALTGTMGFMASNAQAATTHWVLFPLQLMYFN